MWTKNFCFRIRKLAAIIAIGMCCAAGAIMPAKAQQPSWLSNAVIYCVYPELFSPNGLPGVTQQLPRLHTLGITTIWLMPFQPKGVACTVGGISRPSVNSPYCISDLEGIASNMGTKSDLDALVSRAHHLGMKVILDIALNQTSWDNPLITSHPQYYLHSDGNLDNVASIEVGWGMDNDIGQFDLTTDKYGAQTYVTGVCKYWLSTFHLDGFRVDSADNPGGANRSLPSSLMMRIDKSLQTIDPNLLLLGEEDDQALALAPYGLDYDWDLHGRLVGVLAKGDSAGNLQTSWQKQTDGWPAGMMHMAVTQDWDMDGDLDMYGGAPQTLAAATFNFTINYVPLLFNGEEVGNTHTGNNTHDPIDWDGPNAATFYPFYRQLIALRRANKSLQQGSLTWLTNSVPDQVVAYDRAGAGNEFLIEINFSAASAAGTLTAPAGAGWSDVTPNASPGRQSHMLPDSGHLSLQPYDFAIFKRAAPAT